MSLKADVSSVRPSSERLANDKLERLDNDKWSEGNFVCLVNIPDIIKIFFYQTVIKSSYLSLDYHLVMNCMFSVLNGDVEPTNFW